MINYKWKIAACSAVVFSLVACTSPGNKNKSKVSKETNEQTGGTYAEDVAFFKENNIQTIELKDAGSKARVLLIPAYQGRVMTSCAGGVDSQSFGWINYKLIKSGKVNKQFNSYGGEERFWLGPEGGSFSIYFPQGKEQVYENWRVPQVLDTESYAIENQDSKSVTFVKNAELKNASGTEFKVGIKRTIRLLSRDSLSSVFHTDFPLNLDIVAYQSDSTITNRGTKAWTKDKGLISIWLLCMFNPSPTTTVFIPYNTDAEGTIVNDDYFGKVPSDRLIVDNGTVYFKIDGKLRSKIGLPRDRAKGICASYDSEKQILKLLSCSMPLDKKDYVNSKWGKQENHYNGDVINSYNDGPVEDGSIMGPFYEVETSSPGADLKPSESLSHVQRVAHIQGDKADLARIVKDLFALDLDSIAGKF